MSAQISTASLVTAGLLESARLHEDAAPRLHPRRHRRLFARLGSRAVAMRHGERLDG